MPRRDQDDDVDERDDKSTAPSMRKVRADGRVILKKAISVPEDIWKALGHLALDEDHTIGEQFALAAIDMLHAKGKPRLLPPWEGPLTKKGSK